ncbi:recombinase family protein [Nocardioides deserti]|uniref:Recombinase family protein n=1 Tax=Nocardioides deserti TaxID=1588644 RepID=A0ABR6UB03_9ACTN|nr:recombinase family protein [Nocardioides deserti]MBC2961328.1 recombinase family protein [Nocardioides deserti]GGO72423.1 recombinase [Nocardioides deserti]
MNVIGYLRVSTEEQASSGLGLDAQRARITSEAAHRGWTVRWLPDEGYSAKNLHRPALTEALHLLAAGEADALVVAKLDRLSRSVVDFSNTLATAKKQGWAVVLLDLGVDTATPNGKLVAGLMAQIAEWERELIGQRTREALAAAKARGQRLGRPRCTPDEVVAQVVALHDDGLSLRAIARTLTDASVPTTRGAVEWRPSTVRRILTGHRLDLEALASQTAEAL